MSLTIKSPKYYVSGVCQVHRRVAGREGKTFRRADFCSFRHRQQRKHWLQGIFIQILSFHYLCNNIYCTKEPMQLNGSLLSFPEQKRYFEIGLFPVSKFLNELILHSLALLLFVLVRMWSDAIIPYAIYIITHTANFTNDLLQLWEKCQSDRLIFQFIL